jgi:hypothetical protein
MTAFIDPISSPVRDLKSYAHYVMSGRSICAVLSQCPWQCKRWGMHGIDIVMAARAVNKLPRPRAGLPDSYQQETTAIYHLLLSFVPHTSARLPAIFHFLQAPLITDMLHTDMQKYFHTCMQCVCISLSVCSKQV